jgi:hypothetical protein
MNTAQNGKGSARRPHSPALTLAEIGREHDRIFGRVGPDGVRPLRIICGFPGVGKSCLAGLSGYHDSDSSSFSWESDGVRNSRFPANYLEHIRGLTGTALVSSHKVVRDALAEAGMPFYCCYPARECKDEYVLRYTMRGSSPAFVDLLSDKWDDWITEMEGENRAVAHYVARAGKYAVDVIPPTW